MQSGKLDQRITIQSLTETQNSLGETVNSYSTVATVWGRVVTERGTEAFESARVNARETVRVEIRYRSDVTDKHRIQWNGYNYNIVYTDRTKRREGDMWLTCELVGAI
jgi:SPP1 family predicted phage head-tail adaptor